MKIKNLVIVIILLPSLFIVPMAHANTISLAVSPPLLQIQALPPASIAAPFTVANLSDSPAHLTIALKMFLPGDYGTGEVHFLSKGQEFPGRDPLILQKMQVTDGSHKLQTLTLGPKEKKALVLHIGLPKTEPYSDYYFSIVFLESADSTADLSPDEIKNLNASSAQGGIATNVLLSVGPQGTPKGYLDAFSAPAVIESGPVPFTVRVKNAGLHYFTPHGFILITNMFGQTVGRVDLAPDNVLAGSSRLLMAGVNEQVTIQREDTGAASVASQMRRVAYTTSQPTAVWPEKILAGPYSATITLALSDQGPIYRRTIHFLAVPIQAILGIVIAVLLLITIRSRIKQRLS